MASSSVAVEHNTATDATEIPLEDLLQIEYIPASHIANRISNAASAVSIVTAQDIRDYGYRTLSEILGSMKGLYISHDYEYGFLAGRGLSVPGEYAGRVIVLIDGYRADDGYFGQAFLGNDGILDVSVIDRVEYIPGGSSSGYSNGALLGAINIITKSGNDIGGTQVAYGIGSHDSRNRRISFGKRFDNGADVFVGASDYHNGGRDFTYNVSSTEISQHGNSERNHRLFLKTSYRNFSLESAWSTRYLNEPSYQYNGIISDTPIKTSDKNGFARLKYDSDLSDNLKFSSSLWYGRYRYGHNDTVSYTGYDSVAIMDARWYGGDIKLISTGWENHTLSLGAEYRHDYTMGWYSYFLNLSTGVEEYPYYYMAIPRKTYSAYGYDDWALQDDLRLNYGVRYEKSSTDYHALSPQVALIWNATDQTTFKLSTGLTNRQATPSEGDRAEPEKAWLSEIAVERMVDPQTKLTLSLYRYRITDRIYGYPDITTRGAEIELEKQWENGSRLRTNYAYQNAYSSDEGKTPINSARHIAKFNLSAPLMGELLRAGVEVQYIGSRPLYTDARDLYAPSHTLTNITLLSQELLPHCNLTFAAKNVTDTKYGDVVASYINGDGTYHQAGRTFYLQLEYTFQ
jgi:outer membrane receptor for ferrienterochelin and colicins